MRCTSPLIISSKSISRIVSAISLNLPIGHSCRLPGFLIKCIRLCMGGSYGLTKRTNEHNIHRAVLEICRIKILQHNLYLRIIPIAVISLPPHRGFVQRLIQYRILNCSNLCLRKLLILYLSITTAVVHPIVLLNIEKLYIWRTPFNLKLRAHLRCTLSIPVLQRSLCSLRSTGRIRFTVQRKCDRAGFIGARLLEIQRADVISASRRSGWLAGRYPSKNAIRASCGSSVSLMR